MPAWQGLWSHEANNPTGYAVSGRNPDLHRIRKIMAKPGNRNTATLLQALIGAAAGGAASRTRKRITHSVNGGKMAIETVTEVNRTTTSADVTNLKAATLPMVSRPASYPRDLSGNGGPAY